MPYSRFATVPACQHKPGAPEPPGRTTIERPSESPAGPLPAPRATPDHETPVKSSENRPRPTGAGVGPIEILFNPRSGAHDQAQAHACIAAVLAASGRDYRFVPIERPEAIGKLARSLGERARECDGAVVAAGGDGTINAVAQAVLGSGCAFGVLPQGTFNYFSRAHHIPFDTSEALQVLLSEQPQAVQVGLVNDRVFLVNASLGLYPQLLEERENWKHYLGRNRFVAFVAAFFTLMGGYRTLRLQVSTPQVQRKLRTPTLFVGNNALQMEQLGLPLAQDIDRGELAAIVLKPVRRLAMLGLLLRGALGQLGTSGRLLSFPVTRLDVTTAWPFRGRRIKVATDGEIRWLQLPLDFRVSPQPLFLIRPPAAEREPS
ncbi:MAG: diacylglycerol kinase [Rhodocyclaceae bacterium]|nr:diacylglycerol kinase [Rhodocyclaceae bacterium]